MRSLSLRVSRIVVCDEQHLVHINYTIMAKGLIFLIFAMSASSIFCYCPKDKIRNFGPCSFHISCRERIRDVTLPPECLGSPNYPVKIDLVLNDAIERFDDGYIDEEFLATITTFRASAVWHQTNLSILAYMPRLQNLFLFGNHIRNITGSPFFNLSRLEHLDLSHNNLSDLEDLFEFETHPNRMQKLHLAHNAIEEIPGYAFGELSSLIELDLSYNKISDLTEEPFLNLTVLEILRLDNNRIMDLNGAVNHLYNLKHLFLRGNQIQKINDQSLAIIKHLETFDMSMNQLEDLGAAVFIRHWQHFGMNSVCKIILSHNQITFVPNTLKELVERYTRSLKGWNHNGFDVTTELDLSKNAISNIGFDAFQPLIRLVSLDLSHNKIIKFDVDPQDMIDIKYLNLSSNYIVQIYFDNFLSMKNLQNLDLSHNYLEIVPDQTFINNNYLRYVNMSANAIEKLENFRISMFHPEGGVLDLSNNNISKLSIPFGEGLTRLVLQSNEIYDPSLIYLLNQNELLILDMSKNYITNLDDHSFYLPVGLSSLDLSYNEIEIIHPATFRRLEHLKSLKLGYNRLTALDYGVFQGLSYLSNLDLSYNNISNLDSNVMMDLKSLHVLSLKFNGLATLDYKGWLGHTYELMVYLEGNQFSCEWLATALSDFNNGFSKMKPSVLVRSLSGSSLEGIPCVKSEYMKRSDYSFSSANDERLLVIVQKILRAVEEQNGFMKNYVYGTKQIEDEKIRRHPIIFEKNDKNHNSYIHINQKGSGKHTY